MPTGMLSDAIERYRANHVPGSRENQKLRWLEATLCDGQCPFLDCNPMGAVPLFCRLHSALGKEYSRLKGGKARR